MTVIRWTPEREAHLRQNYPHRDTREVAAELGCSPRRCMVKAYELGVRKHKDAKRVWTRGRGDVRTWMNEDAGRYNRGKPGWRLKGLGEEFVSKKGEVYIKVAMTGVKGKDWKLKARVVWEKKHGRTLPKGVGISFVDGNTNNCHPDNLIIRSKRDVMLANTIHNLPKELAGIYRAKGTIIRAINRRNKK